MTRMVADSSTLILLAKCGLLEIVCELFEVLLPDSVNNEVASKKMVRNYPDAALISRLVSLGKLKVQNPGSGRPPIPQSLHRGEEDALFLAIELGRLLLATDDGKAIRAARFLNVPYIVTPKIVVELFRLRKISLEKAHGSLEKLSKIGRYSPEIIAEALIMLMEKKDGKTDNHKDT
ncbi:MAG: hypothetical protein WBN03_04465 [Desulfobacterales bacterium]